MAFELRFEGGIQVKTGGHLNGSGRGDSVSRGPETGRCMSSFEDVGEGQSGWG